MSPTTIAFVAGVPLAAAPGLHYDLLRSRHPAGRAQPGSMQPGRVVISSVLLTMATLVILGIARQVGPGTFLSLGRLINDEDYLPGRLTVACWSAICFLAISLTLGALAAAVFVRIEITYGPPMGGPFLRPPRPEDAAIKVLTHDVELEVKLSNGDTYRGLFGDYSKELDPKERQLILDGPIFHIDDHGKPMPLDPLHWHRLMVPRNAIMSILVRHADGAWKPELAAQSPAPARVYPRHSSPRPSRADQVRQLARSCYERRYDPYVLVLLLTGEVATLIAVAAAGRMAA